MRCLLTCVFVLIQTVPAYARAQDWGETRFERLDPAAIEPDSELEAPPTEPTSTEQAPEVHVAPTGSGAVPSLPVSDAYQLPRYLDVDPSSGPSTTTSTGRKIRQGLPAHLQHPVRRSSIKRTDARPSTPTEGQTRRGLSTGAKAGIAVVAVALIGFGIGAAIFAANFDAN